MPHAEHMRIHRFGGNNVIQIDDIEMSMPDAGEILVQVKAASINPVDFKIRSGKYPAVQDDKLPYTLGRDVSGVVEKCGAQATRFQVGDEIFGMVGIHGGGYAEKVLVKESGMAKKPSCLDHIQASSIPLAGLTAWQGLFRHGGLTSGERILIHAGSGGVGHFAIQFAKAKGAYVITTVSTEHVGFAQLLGADEVIDYKTQKFDEIANNLDMVFDLVDGKSRELSWPLLKQGGRLITTLTEPSQDLAKKFGVRAARYTVEANGDELAEIAKLVESGKVKPHVQKTYTLKEAAEALAAVEEGHSEGKTVLVVD